MLLDKFADAFFDAIKKAPSELDEELLELLNAYCFFTDYEDIDEVNDLTEDFSLFATEENSRASLLALYDILIKNLDFTPMLIWLAFLFRRFKIKEALFPLFNTILLDINDIEKLKSASAIALSGIYMEKTVPICMDEITDELDYRIKVFLYRILINVAYNTTKYDEVILPFAVNRLHSEINLYQTSAVIGAPDMALWTVFVSDRKKRFIDEAFRLYRLKIREKMYFPESLPKANKIATILRRDYLYEIFDIIKDYWDPNLMIYYENIENRGRKA